MGRLRHDLLSECGGKRRARSGLAATAFLAAAVCVLLSAGPCPAAATIDPTTSAGKWEVVTVSTRPGVEVGYLLGEPRGGERNEVFLLFQGGDGAGPFSVLDNGQIRLSANFLVRSAPRFIEHGASVAVVSPPSDKRHGLGCLFRASEDHARDMEKVIESLSGRGFREVFLTGTSNGTLSAAYLGGKIRNDRIKGVVLTSSIAEMGRFIDLSCYIGFHVPRIMYPVLMVHHRDDACRVTPIAEARKLRHQVRTEATFVEVRGGGNPSGDPCEPLHYHGFIGMEDEVVSTIVEWARKKPVPETIGH